MAFELHQLAVPASCLVILFFGYSPQFLFYFLEPGPLTWGESILFNCLVASICWSYERTCRVDPGRLPKALKADEKDGSLGQVGSNGVVKGAKRMCKKCHAVKPPRSHHCKRCGRCIPKMDHHCPWTANCVSHTTFPHFLRFILYSCVSLGVLDYHLIVRAYAIYEQRDLPSYLGPSMYALAHLLVLLAATTMMMFALSVLLVTAVNSLMFNTMMIEHWEIERHEALIERARYMGGFVYGPGGIRVRIKRQEFPYDIGIWKNIVQGMGTNNVLAWVLPWGGGPSSDAGWAFETNGFEDEGTTWPPIDPDKMPRPSRGNYEDGEQAFVHDVDVDVDEDIQAFRRRQEADLQRFRQPSGAEIRQREIEKSTDLNEGGEYELDEDYESEYEEGADGQEGWTSSDGTRLRDFGVDEEAELLDDDDIPLGELLRRRRFVATEEE